jgi:membrane protease YdiL (CAAX protease family)
MRATPGTDHPLSGGPTRQHPDRPDTDVATPTRLVVFLAITFGLTWLAFLPMILGHVDPASTGGFFLLLLGIGAPSFTAISLTAVRDGRGGLRRLWRGGTRWRVGGAWYAAVIGIPAVASGAAWVVAAGQGAETPFNPWIPALISGLLAGLLEEFGWSGYAYPALRARYGSVRAGAVVGVIVATWHLPFFLSQGTTQSVSSFPLFLLTLVAARIVFGWVYDGSGGSILLAVLLHAAGNTWSESLGRGPLTADAPGLTETLVLCVAALAAVLVSRRRRLP